MEVFINATRCPHCTKRMKVWQLLTVEPASNAFSAIRFDTLQTDAVKWAASALGAPTKVA